MTLPKVHLPVLIPTDKLRFLPGNSNKQSKHTFAELKKNILEHGFDESLLVTPNDDGTYTVVSGNHRGRAGMDVGYEELPCVIRPDWDEVTVELQSVRRNYARGAIDKNLFTSQVNDLKERHNLSNTDIFEGMGFKDIDAFAEMYKQEREREDKALEQLQEEASSDAGSIKILDDLSLIISSIIQKYGDTIPHSFIIFPVSGKNHLYIQSNTALKKSLQNIATSCVAKGIDINVAITGLLAIGLAHTDFLNDGPAGPIKEAAHSDEDDADIEIL